MEWVIKLAVTNILGLTIMLVSGGDASRLDTILLYGAGSMLAFGSVGAFCLATRPQPSKSITAETVLFALMMASLLVMVIFVSLNIESEPLLKVLKFLPVFSYFLLISLTANTLARLKVGRASVTKIALKLLFFPFFAASLERDRTQLRIGH